MIVDVKLGISGKLHEKFSQVIDRLGNFLDELANNYGKIPVPYVHGDTMTATTADKAAFLNKFAVVHVEAGIRTFTPNEHFYNRIFTEFQYGKFDWEQYYTFLQDQKIYELGSIEPYPEQFDTRGIEASTGYFALPHELYKKTLTGEGFLEDRMEVVGNTVADAVKISCKKIPESNAFAMYPNMKDKKLIFITVHRRENCEVEERFKAIYFAIKKLVIEGYPVCFLGLNASESAIDRYGLRSDIEDLVEKYRENFAYGPALAHHHEVMDMLMHAGCVMTDSGSNLQNQADFAGRQADLSVIAFFRDELSRGSGGANDLAAPSGLELDIMDGRTYRDARNRHGVPDADFGAGAGDDNIADFQPDRRQNITLFAVNVVQQRDARRAVRIIFDRGDFCRDIRFIAFDVDDADKTPNAAAAMADGNASEVVAPARPFSENDKRAFRFRFRNFFEGITGFVAQARRDRFVNFNCHYSTPSKNLRLSPSASVTIAFFITGFLIVVRRLFMLRFVLPGVTIMLTATTETLKSFSTASFTSVRLALFSTSKAY